MRQIPQTTTYTPREQASAFLSSLLHDDRDSFYVIQTRQALEGWKTFAALRRDALLAFDVGRFGFDDVYVTHNGMSGKRALAEGCRHVNGLLFDLDAHTLRGVALDRAKASCLRALDAAISSGALPDPTMLVDTGRGYQLHYIFERSCSCRIKGGAKNVKLLALVERLRNRLEASIAQAIEVIEGIEMDRAVGNLNRVCRIPGTWNRAAGRRAELVWDTGRFWSLAALSAALPTEEGEAKAARKRAAVIAFDALCINRMRALERLQALREQGRGTCAGKCRNEMMWLYMNSAAQVHGLDAAYEAARAFNSRFKSPLPECELRASRETLSRVGFYRLSADAMSRHLGLTPEEMRTTRFFECSGRVAQRAAAKAATRVRRQARDARVRALVASGATYAQAAEAVGCSRRTVARIMASPAPRGARSDAAALALAMKASSQVRTDLKTECQNLADDHCVLGERGAIEVGENGESLRGHVAPYPPAEACKVLSRAGKTLKNPCSCGKIKLSGRDEAEGARARQINRSWEEEQDEHNSCIQFQGGRGQDDRLPQRCLRAV